MILKLQGRNKEGVIETVNILCDESSIAKAIMYYGTQGNVIVTDIFDRYILDTFGYFLNRVDTSILYELNLDFYKIQNELVSFQQGIKKAPNKKTSSWIVKK